MSDENSPDLIHPSALRPPPSTLAAILLAAGRSRRMGAFKPLLPFGGRTVAQACVENLLRSGVGEIVVVAGHRAGELKAALAHLPVSFALNEAEGSEMGVSIARGVERVSPTAEAVLVALVDHPAVAPETVREIIDARERHGARLVIPVWDGRGGHPVLVDLAFRTELRRLDPARGLRALFDARRTEVLRLPVSSPFVARDMDTWDDYCVLHLEVFGSLPDAERPVNTD